MTQKSATYRFYSKALLFHDLLVKKKAVQSFPAIHHRIGSHLLIHDQNTDTTRNSPAKYRSNQAHI